MKWRRSSRWVIGCITSGAILGFLACSNGRDEEPVGVATEESSWFADCNHDPSDGNETNLRIDPSNCGGCGHVCPTGEPCVDGKCCYYLNGICCDANGGGGAPICPP